MNNFLSNIWYDFLIFLIHGLRGIAFGLFAFGLVLLLLVNTPHEMILLANQSIDLRPAKFAFLYGWGAVCLSWLISLWLKDYKNNYWKLRW